MACVDTASGVPADADTCGRKLLAVTHEAGAQRILPYATLTLAP